MPNYFDAHSHLNFPQYDSDRDGVLSRMRDENIWTITVGTDIETSKTAVDLAEKNEGIFATVGVHPTDVAENFDIQSLEALLSSRKVVSIGECGLDYFRINEGDKAIKEKQKSLFVSQIDLSQRHSLPLMIHARPKAGTMDAYEDVLEILRQMPSKGNVHFFVGTTDIAKKFLDLGFTLSFDGPITFANEYDEVVRFVPLDMILAETDSPFAAPAPYRGKRNEPLYVKEVVSSIARIKNIDVDAARIATVENALRVFSIDKHLRAAMTR